MTGNGSRPRAIGNELLATVFTKQVIASLKPGQSDAHHYIYRLFVDTDDWSSAQREFLADALAMAQRHRVFDQNLIQRLRAFDESVFFGRLYELKVAHHFESNGVSLRFAPGGRHGSALEFEADLPTKLLIEVKSPQRAAEEYKQSKQGRRLVEVAEDLEGSSWIAIDVERAGNFKESRFRAFVAEAMPGLEQRRTGGEQYPATTFIDAQGIRATITLWGPNAGSARLRVTQFTGPTTVRNAESLESTVRRAVRQLPRVRTRATMIVLCPRFSVPSYATALRQALYGTDAIHWGRQGNDVAPQRAFVASGILAANQHRRVSVVTWLNELGERYNPSFELVSFHHPNPYVPIPHELLSRVVNRQMVPTQDGLAWFGNRPEVAL